VEGLGHPPADPFTPAERDRVLDWFDGRTFWRKLVPRRHPAFHAFCYFQIWHGVRPSEAAGLDWDNVDLDHGVAYIRRSFHYREVCAPKTRAARRPVELKPDLVALLRRLRPLRPEPGQPVFPNLDGRRITPRVFWDMWKRGLQDLRIRHHGLYAMKDTFVTLTLAIADETPNRRDELIAFVVRQTGVREDTCGSTTSAGAPGPGSHSSHLCALGSPPHGSGGIPETGNAGAAEGAP